MDQRKRVILRVGLSTLLIVSLIGLMMVIFGDPSPQAYDTRTLSQLQQYMNALELIRLEKGTYPITEDFVCLGDYTDDACWNNGGRGIKEDYTFNDMLDTYIPILSSGRMIEDKKDPEGGREGYIYRSRENGRGYEINYILLGKGKGCGFGQDLSLSVTWSRNYEHTLCTIQR